jgi:NADPH:quinone reductase
MKAAVLRRAGGPDVLSVEELPEPVPAAGQSLVDVTFAGVNFDDLERRTGDRQPMELPTVLGAEVAGRRRADGRRVAVLLRQGGGYAQVVVAEDRHTIELPDHISDEQAVGLLEQGSTAYGALVLVGRLRAGESVAVSAAAGGVGHLAVQLALAYGAEPVIGIASSPDKRAMVANLGAHRVLDPAGGNLVGTDSVGGNLVGTDLDGGDLVGGDLGAQLRAATDGIGVDLFLDSIGGTQALAALSGLAAFGRLVSVGWRAADERTGAPGEPLRVTTEQLIDGSIGCAGFWMRHVVDDRPLLRHIAEELFDLAKRGQLTARIDRIVALDETGKAHAAMAAGATAGKLLIDVNRGPRDVHPLLPFDAVHAGDR